MRRTRRFSAAAAVALATVLGAACSSSSTSTPPQPAYAWAGTYQTHSRWGGEWGTWDPHVDVYVSAAREVYLGTTKISNPTVGADTVSWSTADGNGTTASFTFHDGSSDTFYWESPRAGFLFQGSIQNPGEGPLDFRGALREVGGTVAGILHGASFMAVDFAAVIYPPTLCPGDPANGTAVLLYFTETPDACAMLQAVPACGQKANIRVAAAAVLRLDTEAAPPPVGPGVYGHGTTHEGTTATAGDFAYVDTNATCVDSGWDVEATSMANVRLDTVTPGFVTGWIFAPFVDGSFYQGSFSAATCALGDDVCGGGCPTQGPCVP